jgi:hypothetical protein
MAYRVVVGDYDERFFLFLASESNVIVLRRSQRLRRTEVHSFFTFDEYNFKNRCQRESSPITGGFRGENYDERENYRQKNLDTLREFVNKFQSLN